MNKQSGDSIFPSSVDGWMGEFTCMLLRTIEGRFVCDIVYKQNAHSSSVVSCNWGGVGENNKSKDQS